jgi:hypothetical protein
MVKKVELQITESTKSFRIKATIALVDHINDILVHTANRIEQRLIEVIPLYLTSHATYIALTSGALIGHFGFPKGTASSRVDKIVDMIANQVTVTSKPFHVNQQGKITGAGITVGIVNDLDETVLTAPAIVDTKKGDHLPWLNWLLFRGNELIIQDFRIDFRDGSGRSGQAIMVFNDSRSWRVPSKYAGTVNSNWVTRSLNARDGVFKAHVRAIIVEKFLGAL